MKLWIIPYRTFARHKSSSYSSYEDDIDTNRILIQKSTTLKGQTIKISCLRLVYKLNTFSKKILSLQQFTLKFKKGEDLSITYIESRLLLRQIKLNLPSATQNSEWGFYSIFFIFLIVNCKGDARSNSTRYKRRDNESFYETNPRQRKKIYSQETSGSYGRLLWKLLTQIWQACIL